MTEFTIKDEVAQLRVTVRGLSHKVEKLSRAISDLAKYTQGCMEALESRLGKQVDAASDRIDSVECRLDDVDDVRRRREVGDG